MCAVRLIHRLHVNNIHALGSPRNINADIAKNFADGAKEENHQLDVKDIMTAALSFRTDSVFGCPRSCGTCKCADDADGLIKDHDSKCLLI